MKRSDLWLVGAALIGGLALALVAHAKGPEVGANPEQGIRASMEVNLAACTEENMDKLLACMAKEMPNRRRFIQTVDMTWSVEDAYWRLENVEVLEHSDAPHANCEFPYATAIVTQSRFEVPQRDADRSVFQSACENGQCKNDDQMAKLMAISQDTETVKFQALFKFEDGAWKLVANLTEPVPVNAEIPIPAATGRSVF